ncbi:ATPase, P-type (transporting), HAD superfamily, subfamily IC [Paracoccus pantotrophus]|nr:ATPase, P-type (transporting), HAD superfamily, subfamily IC [Paracoccus pantotrophus]
MDYASCSAKVTRAVDGLPGVSEVSVALMAERLAAYPGARHHRRGRRGGAQAALVVFLFAVGEVLEGVAADKARDGIRALADLLPRTALLEIDGGGTRETPADRLEIGQVVLVRPGDRIPADSEIVAGISGLDESPVTGESLPRSKGPGEPVFAGSIMRRHCASASPRRLLTTPSPASSA